MYYLSNEKIYSFHVKYTTCLSEKDTCVDHLNTRDKRRRLLQPVISHIPVSHTLISDKGNYQKFFK